jgi:phosphomevalonate kinase
VIARAPGKVVISGAYSVLESAPAIVAAVDRYVTVDSARTGKLLTDEVRAAGIHQAYFFDASPLRHAERKLGLGSSAAILVATLAALEWERTPNAASDVVAERVYPKALAAHRLAQAGGSGIDVAACCFGGVQRFVRRGENTERSMLSLPKQLVFEIWASNGAASTAHLLATLREFATQDPSRYRLRMDAQATAAEQTCAAWHAGDTQGIIAGLTAQRHALEQLGKAARIPIVTDEVRVLADLAEARGAAVLPAGAGGGDIALYVGIESPEFMQQAIADQHHARLRARFGAAGVQPVSSEAAPSADPQVNQE